MKIVIEKQKEGKNEKEIKTHYSTILHSGKMAKLDN
jgi:hypothetical protein